MKTALIIAVAFCIALIGTALYLTLHQNTHVGPRVVPISALYTDRVSKGYWIRGNATPKVTLTEFGDFQCPACRAMEPIIQQSLQVNKDIAQLQYHTYPLIAVHANAQQAAEAAEAAGRQGKFWEMHDMLFANQTTWETLASSDFATTLDGYASSLKINTDQFKQDVADSTIGDQIAKDVSAGNAIQLQGTPTILINGTKPDKLPGNADELNTLLLKAASNAHT